MSNASLKEQLQALASQIVEPSLPKPKPNSTRPLAKKIKALESSKKSKPKWLDYAQYGVELLKAYFPASFKSTNEVIPLKKGIKQDLVKRLSTIADIVIEDKACMVKSLAYYVNTAAYHKNMIAGATRVDLDGNASDAVTALEAQYSLERQQSKLKAKKEAPQIVNQSISNKKEEVVS